MHKPTANPYFMPMIIKRIFILPLLCFLLVAGHVNAQQDGNTPTGNKFISASRPDIPGTLSLDFGFNLLSNNISAMNTAFFGSKMVNLQYKWELPLAKNKLFLHTGLGLGLDKYSFADDITLRSTFVGDARGPVQIRQLTNVFGSTAEFSKSNLAVNYLDIPIEFHYRFKETYSSFKVAVGGRIGVLYSAHTKVNYTRADETFQVKEKDRYELNTFRYGVNIRAGSPGFGGHFYYGLNTLFKDGRGPQGNEANQMQLGLYFGIF